VNSYLNDAKHFLCKCSVLISDEMSEQATLDATLFFAVGIERLLKAILCDLNPVFVYVDQSFKNVAPLLYKMRLVSSAQPNKEFAKQPDSKVISFRLALLRTKEFSATTHKYYNTLFSLSEARDVILHRELRGLDLEKAKALLANFLPISQDYAQERGISLPELIGEEIHGLEFLTNQYRADLPTKVEKKLQYYRDRWKRRRNDPSQSERLKHLFQTYTDLEACGHAECPACGNIAVFSMEADFDYSDGQRYPVGVYPTALCCPFCGFYTNDGAEMDHLKLHEVFYQHEEM